MGQIGKGRSQSADSRTRAEWRRQTVSPVWHQERQPGMVGYFCLPATFLSAMACFFFWSAMLAAACFCEDFFWFDFGDLSPIIFIFCALTHLRHVSFSEGKLIMPAGKAIVNDGSKVLRKKMVCGRHHFRSNNNTRALSLPASFSFDSSLTATPSPAASGVPLSSTLPSAT